MCASKRPIAADRCLLRASTTDLLPCDISHASDNAVPRSLNQPTPLFPHLAPFLGVIIPILLQPLVVFHGGFSAFILNMPLLGVMSCLVGVR